MKYLTTCTGRFFTVLLGASFCMACSSQKDYITESDYSYTGKFKSYKTFHFTQLVENDSLILKDMIEETIISKFDAQGYSLTEKKPDLLVTYKLYADDFNMHGYDQPNIEMWVYNEYGDKLFEDEEDNRYSRTPPSPHLTAEYDSNKYKMYGGTLLITFFDTKRRKTVWQGYSSGVFTNNYESAERNVKLATAKILREFKLVADGYVIRRGA